MHCKSSSNNSNKKRREKEKKGHSISLWEDTRSETTILETQRGKGLREKIEGQDLGEGFGERNQGKYSGMGSDSGKGFRERIQLKRFRERIQEKKKSREGIQGKNLDK